LPNHPRPPDTKILCLMNDLPEAERQSLPEYSHCDSCNIGVRSYELQKGEYLCDGWGNWYNTWYHMPRRRGGWIPYCFAEKRR
jgi:hypothetical protein